MPELIYILINLMLIVFLKLNILMHAIKGQLFNQEDKVVDVPGRHKHNINNYECNWAMLLKIVTRSFS